MLFNSHAYLIYFLPIAVLVFFALGENPRWAVRWLVAASLFFFAWWNPVHLPLIVASVAANFGFARRIERSVHRKRWLIAGVAANLALLGFFKYADFVLRSLAQIGLVPLVQLDVALPLGISFFTFTQIAFLVDVGRRKAVEPSADNYALFVTFFPHLLAGPIIHHSEMMPQFASATNKRVAWDNVAAGLFLLAVGLAKKVFLADPLVPLVTAGFDQATAIGAVQAWVSALAYTLQIYFDFSGYTDMALGAALLFNIRLPINFDSPYRSLSLREFWHRWHMTLSRFLREYVYVPLGGNRAREARVLGNLLVTFLLGGLWHGAAWTFVCWGALHGLGLCVQRVWNHSGRRLPAWVAWPMTFLFVVVTWVFFRAHSLDDAFAIVRAMAGGSSATATASTGGVREVLQSLWTAHEAAALSMLAGLAVVFTRRNSNVLVREIAPSWFLAAATAGALTLAVLQLGRVAPFLYFNF